MVWVCKVCGKVAEYVCDIGASRANKQGKYSIHRNGYCEDHKPIIMTIEEYTECMKKADG